MNKRADIKMGRATMFYNSHTGAWVGLSLITGKNADGDSVFGAPVFYSKTAAIEYANRMNAEINRIERSRAEA